MGPLRLQKEKIIYIAEHLSNLFINNQKLIICGNGGSAADAQHLAAEFLIRFDKKNLKKFSLLHLSYFLINLIGLINNIFFGIVILSQFLYSFNYMNIKSRFKILIMNYFLVPHKKL